MTNLSGVRPTPPSQRNVSFRTVEMDDRRSFEIASCDLKGSAMSGTVQLTKEEAAELRSQTATSTPVAVDGATRPMCSPSKAGPCSPASFEATGDCGEHRDHARVRRATPVGCVVLRRREAARGPGKATKAKLGQHDQQLTQIFAALRQLISPPPRPRREVGFQPRGRQIVASSLPLVAQSSSGLEGVRDPKSGYVLYLV